MSIRRRLKSMTRKDMLKAFRSSLEKAYSIFDKKSKDYDISTMKAMGAIGPFLRAKEKFDRLEHLLLSKNEPEYESIKDNIGDIFVLLGVLMAMFESQLADVKTLKKQYQTIMLDEE